MRYFLTAAALFFAPFLAPGQALASTFDLSLDEANGERTIMVARPGGGAFAIAVGGEDLSVLTGEDADRARALLKQVESLDDDEGNAEAGAKQKKKIVIHKMSVDDDSADDDVEVRILRKSRSDPREASGGADDETLLADPQLEDPATAGGRRRVLRLTGADAAEAIKFIDDAKGLDAGEKALMKAAVGL